MQLTLNFTQGGLELHAPAVGLSACFRGDHVTVVFRTRKCPSLPPEPPAITTTGVELGNLIAFPTRAA
jgi:hypothetical protein